MLVDDASPLAGVRERTMSDRDEAFRTRIVQQMILGALLVRPPSRAAVERIREASRRLHVEDGMIDVAGGRCVAAVTR